MIRKRKWTKFFISIGLVVALQLSTVLSVYVADEMVIQSESMDETVDRHS